MKNIQMSSDWLRVALLLSEISHYWLVRFTIKCCSLSLISFFVINIHTCIFNYLDPRLSELIFVQSQQVWIIEV